MFGFSKRATFLLALCLVTIGTALGTVHFAFMLVNVGKSESLAGAEPFELDSLEPSQKEQISEGGGTSSQGDGALSNANDLNSRQPPTGVSNPSEGLQTRILEMTEVEVPDLTDLELEAAGRRLALGTNGWGHVAIDEIETTCSWQGIAQDRVMSQNIPYLTKVQLPSLEPEAYLTELRRQGLPEELPYLSVVVQVSGGSCVKEMHSRVAEQLYDCPAELEIPCNPWHAFFWKSPDVFVYAMYQPIFDGFLSFGTYCRIIVGSQSLPCIDQFGLPVDSILAPTYSGIPFYFTVPKSLYSGPYPLEFAIEYDLSAKGQTIRHGNKYYLAPDWGEINGQKWIGTALPNWWSD